MEYILYRYGTLIKQTGREMRFLASDFKIRPQKYYCIKTDLDGPVIVKKRSALVEKYISRVGKDKSIVFSCDLFLDHDCVIIKNLEFTPFFQDYKEIFMSGKLQISFYSIHSPGDQINILALFCKPVAILRDEDTGEELKTFEEWKELGKIVEKGQKATRINGKYYFRESQVVEEFDMDLDEALELSQHLFLNR